MDITEVSAKVDAMKASGWTEEIAAILSAIREGIDGFVSTDPGIWSRRDLRDMNFEDLVPRIQRLQFLAARLRRMRLVERWSR
jgi:hypothetical protein